MKRSKEQFYGCLLGGAIGDAFGAPVKSMKYEEVQKLYGEEGIHELIQTSDRGKAIITDDTQLTMFTAEGLLRSIVRANQKQITKTRKDTAMIIFRAYLRWLYTQGLSTPNWGSKAYDGWIVQIKKLHGYREPGITCITSLGKGIMGTLEKPLNDSKRCGTVIRTAPIGLVENEEDVFKIGCRVGAITHGHPTAYRASGVLSAFIFYLLEGYSLEEGIGKSVEELKTYRNHEECLEAIERAIELAKKGDPARGDVESFGDGFSAQDALGMAIYCSLCYPNNFEAALKLAINQSGNSNSAAAITGNILGTYLGISKIDEQLIQALDLQKELSKLAEDLYIRFESNEEWIIRYPGW